MFSQTPHLNNGASFATRKPNIGEAPTSPSFLLHCSSLRACSHNNCSQEPRVSNETDCGRKLEPGPKKDSWQWTTQLPVERKGVGKSRNCTRTRTPPWHTLPDIRIHRSAHFQFHVFKMFLATRSCLRSVCSRGCSNEPLIRFLLPRSQANVVSLPSQRT